MTTSIIANDFSPVTPKEFVKIFPEFKGIAIPAITFQLELSMQKNNQTVWGEYWRFAVILETAHELAVQYNIVAGLAEAGKNGMTSTGFVSSESVGPSSMSRSTQAPSWMTGDDVLDSYYGRTWYGQRYLGLLIVAIPPGKVVMSPPITRQGTMTRPGYRSVTAP